MSNIFIDIDINIFYNVLFKTSLTQTAGKLLEEFENNKSHTSLTAVDEMLYIATRRY